jgi:hypothetical protein
MHEGCNKVTSMMCVKDQKANFASFCTYISWPHFDFFLWDFGVGELFGDYGDLLVMEVFGYKK